MTQIKICGLSRIEDIDAVNLYKPNYVGFVFAKSKRQIDLDTAKKLIGKLSKKIKTVGVFVNEAEVYVSYVADYLKLDVIQLHGDESVKYLNILKKLTSREIWKAIRVKNKEDLERASEYPVDRVLLDTYSDVSFGGSGESFDWSILEGINKSKIILAGGLNIENITEAISAVSPYMLDVSSGAETNGVKDIRKIKQLVEIVKGA